MNRLFPLLSATFVLGCAPAIPPRPELPPVTAEAAPPTVSGTAASSAPAIPKPDLSTVSAEVKARTQGTAGR